MIELRFTCRSKNCILCLAAPNFSVNDKVSSVSQLQVLN